MILCSLFALLLLATLALGEVAVRSVENPYKIKDCAMHAGGAPVRTVVLGDSHAYFGIRPDMLPGRAVSLANVSQTLSYDLRLLEHYAPQLDSLSTLVIAVCHTSLYDPPLEETSEWWRAINYQLYNHLRLHSPFSRYGAELAHISVYNIKLKSLLTGPDADQQCDPSGHGMSYTLARRSADWESEGAAIARRHDEGLKLNTRQANLARLDSILDFAAARGARVVMVGTPEWHTYMEAIPRERYRKNVATFDSIAASRSTVTYLNFTEDARFGADDFYDPDHLTSDRGATLLTKLIREHLSSH